MKDDNYIELKKVLEVFNGRIESVITISLLVVYLYTYIDQCPNKVIS